MPHSVWVSKQLGRPVIKAFNNILAHSFAELGRPEGSPDRLAIAVSGDDVRPKQIVMDIVNETGFDPVDAGPLTSRGGSSQERLLIAAIMMPRRRGEGLQPPSRVKRRKS
jgi:predicted dinucleotide-binding enzyme